MKTWVHLPWLLFALCDVLLTRTSCAADRGTPELAPLVQEAVAEIRRSRRLGVNGRLRWSKSPKRRRYPIRHSAFNFGTSHKTGIWEAA